MAPRAYNSDLRRRKQAELKARIAAATAALHAERGAHATSYADIAAAANVSLPTVYAHFPTLDELFEGCTSHVAASAPAFPVDAIEAAPTLDEAARRLVEAIDARHRHFEPWLAWRQDRVFPFLAELAETRRVALTGLITRVLQRHLGPGEHREAVAGWETTLSFDAWHRLSRAHGLTAPAVRRTMLRCLVALAAPPPPPRSPRPARSKR